MIIISRTIAFLHSLDLEKRFFISFTSIVISNVVPLDTIFFLLFDEAFAFKRSRQLFFFLLNFIFLLLVFLFDHIQKWLFEAGCWFADFDFFRVLVFQIFKETIAWAYLFLFYNRSIFDWRILDRLGGETLSKELDVVVSIFFFLLAKILICSTIFYITNNGPFFGDFSLSNLGNTWEFNDLISTVHFLLGLIDIVIIDPSHAALRYIINADQFIKFFLEFLGLSHARNFGKSAILASLY